MEIDISNQKLISLLGTQAVQKLEEEKRKIIEILHQRFIQ